MKKYVYIPMLLVLFILYGIDAKSGDCSSVNTLITDSVNDYEVKFDDFAVGSVAKVDFKFRPATQTTEGVIIIDWNSVTDFQIGMNEETLKDIIQNAILRKLGREQDTLDTLVWGVYIVSNCYATLNCVYKIDTTRENCCDNFEQSSPIQNWEIAGETFMSVPFARYVCSKKCCVSFYKIWKTNYIVSPTLPVRPSVFISLDRKEVFSDCSPDSFDVAPHCLLSSDPSSPYYREWDPYPKSSTCEGGCP